MAAARVRIGNRITVDSSETKRERKRKKEKERERQERA